MPFGIGGSKNKSDSKESYNQNQNSTTTTAVNVPGYIQQPTQNYYNLVNAQMGNLFGTGTSQPAQGGSTPPTSTNFGPTPESMMAASQQAAAGNVNPSYYATGKDWTKYLQDNPDVQQWAASGHGDPNIPIEQQTPEQRAAYQYQNSGQGEGRTVADTAPAAPGAPPAKLVPGASPQQQAAYNGALNLGGNQGLYNAASQLNVLGGMTPAERAAATTIDPTSNVATTNVNGIERINPISLGAAAQYGGTNAGDAALANRVNLGDAAQYGGTTVAPTKTFDAQSVLANLPAYMNPYTNDVVNTTLAGYDQNAASQKAAMAAQAAKSGAFGGSRYGLASSNFDAQTGQNRAATEAGLRSNAFTAGAALSGQDADRRQSAAQTNTAAQNAAAALQAQLQQESGLFNTGQTNTFALNQGQMDQTRNLANMGAQNERSALQANFNQQTGLFNTGAVNDRSLAQGQMDYNVGSSNAGAQNAHSAQQAQLDAAKAQADAAAANARAMQDAQLAQQNAQFNATQGENEKNRQLAAAISMMNIGNSMGDSQRQNINTQLAAGQDNRAVQFDQNTEDLQKLAAVQGLLGINPASLFGSTANTVGTTNGTDKKSGTGYGVSGTFTG